MKLLQPSACRYGLFLPPSLFTPSSDTHCPLLQTIDEQMSKIKIDAADLCDPNFAPSEPESDMHATMQKAIEAVRSQLQDLTKTYEKLMTTCQQKRDLYIVCVKFHMNLRQVSPTH